MNIRRAQTKDIPGVIRNLRQVLEVHAALRPDLFISGTTKYTPEDLEKIFANENTPVFVGVNDRDEVMGYAFCVMEDMPANNNMPAMKTLYIDDICVDEHFRRQHVAQDLYRHVLDYAREQGCYNVTLNVWEGNDYARAFYEKMGMGIRKTMMEQIL